MGDEEFLAWLYAPLSTADLLRLEVDELRYQAELAAAAEAEARDAALTARVVREIEHTVSRMQCRAWIAPAPVEMMRVLART
jgi:hypothetical protein